jgi:quinol monooxygenase YgiN
MKLAFRFLLGSLMMSALGVVPAARAADDAGPAYIVAYLETLPPSAKPALALLRELSKASRAEAGSLGFEVLRQIGQPDQFVILEAWKDKDAQAAHASAAHTSAFREKLKPLLRGPYDERPHSALGVGPARAAGAAKTSPIYAVTHVDVIGKAREEGSALVKRLSADSRKDKGNLRFDSWTQISRPNHMTVVEIWADRKALEAHSVTAHKKKFRDQLAPLGGSLYDERLYRAVN